MTPVDIEWVFGRRRLQMSTGDHVEVVREETPSADQRRYTKRFLETTAGDFRSWTEREWGVLNGLGRHAGAPVCKVATFQPSEAGGPACLQTWDAGVTVDQWATLVPLRRAGIALHSVFGDCVNWWALARHALLALDTLHGLGFVHLDLKADNVCIPWTPAGAGLPSPGQPLAPHFANLAFIDVAYSLLPGVEVAEALPLEREPGYEYQSPRLLEALGEGSRGNLMPARALDWRCDLFSLAAMLWLYLPESEEAQAADWTPTRHDQASALVRLLLDAHDADTPAQRPHRNLIGMVNLRLREPELAAALRAPCTFDPERATPLRAEPTPRTRITPRPVARMTGGRSRQAEEWPASAASRMPEPVARATLPTPMAARAADTPVSSARLRLATGTTPSPTSSAAPDASAPASASRNEPPVGAAGSAPMLFSKSSREPTFVAVAPASRSDGPPRSEPAQAPAVAAPTPPAPTASSGSHISAATEQPAALSSAFEGEPGREPTTDPWAQRATEGRARSQRGARILAAVGIAVLLVAAVAWFATISRTTRPGVTSSAQIASRALPASIEGSTPVGRSQPATKAERAEASAPALNLAATPQARTPGASADKGETGAAASVPQKPAGSESVTGDRNSHPSAGTAPAGSAMAHPTDRPLAIGGNFEAVAAELMRTRIPRLAQDAESKIAGVLAVAANARELDRRGKVRAAARAVRASAARPAFPVAGDVQEARTLNEAAMLAYRRGNSVPEAVRLQTKAFGANPLDSEIVGNLAFFHLKESPPEAETSRQLALHALTLNDTRFPRGRIEDWTTFAVASALTGRDPDARNAWFVSFALASDVRRQCYAALRAQAIYGERLRPSVQAMLQRVRSSPTYESCDWSKSPRATRARAREKAMSASKAQPKPNRGQRRHAVP